jgi:hypothetical protein
VLGDYAMLWSVRLWNDCSTSYPDDVWFLSTSPRSSQFYLVIMVITEQPIAPCLPRNKEEQIR